ncbi:alpha/beta hydrolase [Altererythrobacter sp. SALINAS58]|uniref:alpha/beta hydrolase n=1 Tax=Alteripontixanthobacter muriae TaxID=2705546 RepID=UPI0015750B96|nr:alpha/beta hydrolase [Alteripontixanthobacter muriae]NTZ43813.1 alpha/beta hydrolase [Alteripontixanthobacter muriae]
MRALIDALPSGDLTPENLAQTRMRARVDARLFDMRLPPSKVEVERQDGCILSALLFDPPRSGQTRGAILHLHGGGMVMGSPDMARVSGPQIALDHGVVLLSLDYRLAPEHPFPAQLEDGEAALDWLLANAEPLGIEPSAIFLMGESAGGGLAAGLALKLRDCRGPTIAGQILTYPMLDHRTGGALDPYDHGPAGEFIWTGTQNTFGWASLVGGRAIERGAHGWLSPSTAEDLAGLPPSFIATGALDLFAAENLRFAERLCAAGTPCELHLYSGAIHGFDMLRRSALAGKYQHDRDRWISGMLTPLCAGDQKASA